MEQWQLKQMLDLPLEVKVEKTKIRIREWHNYWDGMTYVAFSGGKDSIVLLDLVRQEFPDTVAVFVNTGVEYPEMVRFVRSVDNVVIWRPTIKFKDVITKFGYPVVSKETAEKIESVRNPNISRKTYDKYMGSGSFSIPAKYRYLIDAPFKISSKCCGALKRSPMHTYEKRTGRKPYIGTKATDSRKRLHDYLKTGCNSFTSKRASSTPLAFWRDCDIISYIEDNDISYCKDIYGDIENYQFTKLGNTGCIYCAFGCQFEDTPNRFQRLKETHPKLYKYCMKDLGWLPVLDYMQIPYE